MRSKYSRGLVALLFLAAACGAESSQDPGASSGDSDAGAPATDSAAPLVDASASSPADTGAPSGDRDAAASDARDASDAGSADAADPSAPPGLTWPVGQTFPSFGSLAGTLDVIDLTALSAEKQTLTVTLAGLINRAKPRLYTLDDGGEGKRFWLDKLGVATSAVSDPLALVTKYRAEISGIVIYDDAQIDTLNLATTLAGLKDGIVASPTLSATLAAAPYSLPVIADLRTNHFASKLDVYTYALNTYGASASHRLICGLAPSIAGHLRDYAVATRALVVWLDPRDASEKALLGQILGRLDPASPYLGWWADEATGVAAAASSGISVFAADFASNLTVFGGTPRTVHVPVPPPPPALATKIYVTMIMSDGDNLQLNQHLIPKKWADPKRGSVPIGWTMNPGLLDVAPVILDYFWSTASANDVLVSGPSGLGYTYPNGWPPAAMHTYTKQSAKYLEAAGLRAITVWNLSSIIQGDFGADLSAGVAQDYSQNMPHLLGLAMQGEWIQYVHDNTVLNGTLPMVRLAQPYGNAESDIESAITKAAGSWNRTSPYFVAVQGNLNSGGIDPGAFATAAQKLASNADVVFVRTDHFFQLFRAANNLSVDP